jgi:RNA polymerase sigma factor (TIGR02999 family)
MASTGIITQLLHRWGDGDKAAVDELVPLIYDELRRIATAYINRERHQITLDPAALVHEAYLRLIAQQQLSFQCRTQFFGLAAKLMRNILVDRAREKGAIKRGRDQHRVSLTRLDQQAVEPDMDLIALDDAMKELAKLNPRQSQIIELRFFGGLTIPETAEVLEVSHATVEQEWRFARTWLHRRLSA